jgi:hypothetical protein
MKPNKNNSTSHLKNKPYLVQKISQALLVKYDKAFEEANYTSDNLKNDVENLINSQYANWNVKKIFEPVEKDILNIVKNKSPNVDIKVKKARYIPRDYSNIDKYQEADLEEKNKIDNINNNKTLKKRIYPHKLEKKEIKNQTIPIKNNNTKTINKNNNNNNNKNNNNNINSISFDPNGTLLQDTIHRINPIQNYNFNTKLSNFNSNNSNFEKDSK